MIDELNHAIDIWFTCKVFENHTSPLVQGKVNQIASYVGKWVKDIVTDLARNVARRAGAVPEPEQVIKIFQWYYFFFCVHKNVILISTIFLDFFINISIL